MTREHVGSVAETGDFELARLVGCIAEMLEAGCSIDLDELCAGCPESNGFKADLAHRTVEFLTLNRANGAGFEKERRC